VKTISIKREGRRWYVILTCDGVGAEPLPPTGSEARSTLKRTNGAKR
jgi:putative transposase